jgi:transcription elongation factor Elf1
MAHDYREKTTDEMASVDCEKCGENTIVAAEWAAMNEARLCGACQSAEEVDRLTNALLLGNRYERADAARELNKKYPDSFPVRHDGKERWVVLAEKADFGDGGTIGRWVEVLGTDSPCPECGNTRVEHRSFDTGAVKGFVDECTVCGHVRDEEVA